MEYENDQRYPEDDAAYSRDRSRSPRADRDGDTRIRDGGDDRAAAAPRVEPDDEAPNEGSNLFCTGINPRLTEGDIQRMFEKYGDVESCSIMRDPHTRESRGFGFVKMRTAEEADAARNGLNGEQIEGRTLSIEKARRCRPRTPTPGKYFGPPKRDDRRGGGRFGGDRYDRRGDFGGRRERYDDRGGYRDRYDDRGYGSRRDRDDYYGGRGGGGSGSGGGGGGGGYRDDRYGRDDRRGGGGYGSYDRSRDGGYAEGAAPPSRSAGGYDDDRYARR